MLEVSKLAGIVPPLATPLQADESLDQAALDRMVDRLLAAGVHAIFVAGSTGEFAALTDDVRKQVVEQTVQRVAGRVPVLVGVGDSGTRRCEAWARQAEAAGADAVVAILPYYYATPSTDEVLAHFEALAGATGLPLVLYNIPSRTKSAIPVEAVARLRTQERVIGIKDSAEEMNTFYRLLELRSERFHVLQGSEMQCLASLLLGADGAVLGISNLAPRLCVNLYQAARAGQLDLARSYQAVMADLNRIYFLPHTSPYGSLKYALSLLGVCQPHVTRPLASPDAAARGQIEALVKKHRDQF